MSAPKVTAVTEASPAARAGVCVGDEIVSLNGRRPRDVLEYRQLVDGEVVDLVVQTPDPGRPGAAPRPVTITKQAGEPLGVSVASAVFDRVRTCDNHCAFCFIHQLPKGMRRSLYLKDDDYRLSFLYGNFTTLTRFTELDAERVLDERLGPLFVSIHATDPAVRARMLRNPKGATSLRWLRVLLDGGIEVHGQVVVCPGINDGAVFEDTLVTVLDRYPELATLGVVPLGLSRYSAEPDLRPHTVEQARAVCDAVGRWQDRFRRVLGRRLVFAADEYYLMAGLPFPAAAEYEGFPQHENGIGMARAFEAAFGGDDGAALGVRPGFFAWVEGAPAAGYRAPRAPGTGGTGSGAPAAPDPAGHAAPTDITAAATADAATTAAATGRQPTTVLTGAYGARVLGPLLEGWPGVRVHAVGNGYWGGNIGVAGLMTGADVAAALGDLVAGVPGGRPAGRFLLPDACLSEGRFLDGLTLADLPVPVEVVAADGRSLRQALEEPR